MNMQTELLQLLVLTPFEIIATSLERRYKAISAGGLSTCQNGVLWIYKGRATESIDFAGSVRIFDQEVSKALSLL